MEGTSISLVCILRFLSGFIFYLLSRVLQPPPAQLWGWCCGSQGGLCCRSPTNGQHKLRNKGSLLNDETRQACLSHHQIVIWICFWFWQTQPIYKYWDGNAVYESRPRVIKQAKFLLPLLSWFFSRWLRTFASPALTGDRVSAIMSGWDRLRPLEAYMLTYM